MNREAVIGPLLFLRRFWVTEEPTKRVETISPATRAQLLREQRMVDNLIAGGAGVGLVAGTAASVVSIARSILQQENTFDALHNALFITTPLHLTEGAVIGGLLGLLAVRAYNFTRSNRS